MAIPKSVQSVQSQSMKKRQGKESGQGPRHISSTVSIVWKWKTLSRMFYSFNGDTKNNLLNCHEILPFM